MYMTMLNFSISVCSVRLCLEWTKKKVALELMNMTSSYDDQPTDRPAIQLASELSSNSKRLPAKNVKRKKLYTAFGVRIVYARYTSDIFSNCSPVAGVPLRNICSTKHRRHHHDHQLQFANDEVRRSSIRLVTLHE